MRNTPRSNSICGARRMSVPRRACAFSVVNQPIRRGAPSRFLAILLSLSAFLPSVAPRVWAAECAETWLFNSSTEGWTAAHATLSSVGGYLHVHPNDTSNDPQAVSPIIAFTPSAYDYIRIQVRSFSSSGAFQIYYKSGAHPAFAEPQSKTYTIAHDGSWNYYTIPLSGSYLGNSQLAAVPGWTDGGNITSLRLDPAKSSSGDVDIDFVAVRRDDQDPQAPVLESATLINASTGAFTVTAHADDPAPPCVAGGVNPDLYGSGVYDFGWRVDGGPETWQPNDGADPISGRAHMTLGVTVGAGCHTLSIRSRDRCGRIGVVTNVPLSVSANTITASAGANGSISPSGGVSLSCGASQVFTITPNSCYWVANVIVDGSSVGAVTSYPFTNVQGNHTISASFAPASGYTITASAGANGSISPAGAVSISCGGSQTFTITPNPCFHVADVVVNGSSVGAVTSRTFSNVQANQTISATFAINTYTIAASAGANGAISPSGSVSVNCGGSQSFTITPNACYQVSGVTVDGVAVGAVSSHTLTNIQANHSISAAFVLNGTSLPAVPTGLTVTNLGTARDLSVAWTAVAGATSYTVHRTGGSGSADIAVSATSFTNSGLTPRTTYTYTVAAISQCGTGGYSSPKSRAPDYYPVLLVNGICSDAHLWTKCSVPPLGWTELPNCLPADDSRLGDGLRARGLSHVWVVGYDRNKRLYSTVPAIMAAINAVLAATGEQKLNLVAHSQGGLICRSLLQTQSGYPSKVNNLVMIGTPNHGTALANLAALNLFATPFFSRVRSLLLCLLETDAVYDLVPGSGFLQQLNYGAVPCSQSHRCDTYLLGSCGSHQPEDLARDATGTKPDYWLLAGTGQWCGLEQKFNGLIGCTPNDGAVALASARLQALPSNHWTTDNLLNPGSRASHFGPSAGWCNPEEVRYDKFGDAVYRILTGVSNPLAPSAAQPGVQPRPVSPSLTSVAADGSLETSFLPSIVGTLASGETRRDTVLIDSCAEVGFLQSLELQGAGLELISPSGLRFTPADTASGAVRYSANDDLAFQELTVVNPEAGPWVVESQGPSSGTTQTLELLTSVVATAAMRISLPSDELTPGGPVNIQAWLELESGPDATAVISGTIVAPDASLATLSFFDDGAHGDGAVGDGVFGATYTPNLGGAYGVSAQATHLAGADGSLSRARTAAFVVELLPDLEISANDVVVGRTRQGGPSDSLLVTATIHNVGAVDASGARVLLLGSSGEEFHSEAITVVAGGQAVVTSIWTPANPDLDTLVVVADANFAFLQQRYDNDTVRVVLEPQLVRVDDVTLPKQISLAASYPNPARFGANISFGLPRATEISLRVYDVAGRLVRTIVEGHVEAGFHSEYWDARDNNAAAAPAGIYFYRLRAEGQLLVRMLVIMH